MSLTTKKSWEKHAFLTRSSSQDCKKQSKTKTHFNFRHWQVDVSSLIFAFPNRHQGDQYLKANHSRQTFLSKSKASDKRSHFIFVSVRWGSLTFYSAEKPLKEHLVWRTSHLGALWARSCLHSAVHIWRKLKQMKTNTSFLMLLLVMKHRCDAFRVPPSFPPLPPLSSHTFSGPSRDFGLTKYRRDGSERRFCVTARTSTSSGVLSRWVKFGGAQSCQNNSIFRIVVTLKQTGCFYVCQGTHRLP